MKRKAMCIVLCAAMLLLCGCGGVVGEIASNVADVAMAELENQVKKVLEENKLEVVEMKTVVGQLNDESQYQFFTAALVKSEATAIPQSTADTLAKIFTDAGLLVQTDNTVDSPYLVYKDVVFKHSDYSDGNYYVIFAYFEDLTTTLPDINSGSTQPTE